MFTVFGHPAGVFVTSRAPMRPAPRLEFFQPEVRGTGAGRIGHDYPASADTLALRWPRLSAADAEALRRFFLAAGGMADAFSYATLPAAPLETADGAGNAEWFSAADGWFYPSDVGSEGATEETVRFAAPELQATERAPDAVEIAVTLLRLP